MLLSYFLFSFNFFSCLHYFYSFLASLLLLSFFFLTSFLSASFPLFHDISLKRTSIPLQKNFAFPLLLKLKNGSQTCAGLARLLAYLCDRSFAEMKNKRPGSILNAKVLFSFIFKEKTISDVLFCFVLFCFVLFLRWNCDHCVCRIFFSMINLSLCIIYTDT